MVQSVSVPAAQGFIRPSAQPKVSGGGNSVTITHRELVSDVLVPGDPFTVTSYPLNPGMGMTFPWLSGIAMQYESYRVNYFRAVYEPACPTTQQGNVLLAIDFDASDAAPPTKQVMTSYSGCIRGPVWQRIVCTAAKRDLEKMCPERYVRFYDLANIDIKTYDFGKLYLATTPGGGGVYGELWIEYSIQFYTPQLPSEIEYAHSAKIVGNPAGAPAAPFLAGAKVGGLPVEITAQNSLTFKEAGEYLLEFMATGSVFNGQAPVLGGTITTLPVTITTVVTAAATAFLYSCRAKINSPGEVMTCTFAGVCATLAALNLRIAPYAFTLL